jgi:trimeric autotransporter adhesin
MKRTCLLLVVCLAGSRSVFAQTPVVWNGRTNANWNERTNWSSGALPTAAQSVVIPVVVSGRKYPLVTAGTSPICGALSVDAGASLTVNGYLTVNGALTDAGSIVIQPPTNASGLMQLAARNNLTITATGTLAINTTGAQTNSGNLIFTGALNANASFVNNGTITSSDEGVVYFGNSRPITFSGSGTTSLSYVLFTNLGNAPVTLATTNFVDVRRRAMLNGSDVYSNGKLRLTSDANSTGILFNQGVGVIPDEIYAQRYIEPTAENASPSVGYRHYSSPVAGATFAMFEDGTSFQAICDPNQTPYPAYRSVTPYPNIYLYNQDLLDVAAPANAVFDCGWQSVPNKQTELELGRGYTVNISAINTNTNAPNTVTLHGVPHTGDVVSPSYGRGNYTDSGWTMVGNPYPGFINMRLVTGDNLVNGFSNSVYKAVATGQYSGRYEEYNFNDDADDAANQFWPMMQGFFVRRIDAANTAPYQFSDAHRVGQDSYPTTNVKAFNRVAASVAIPAITLAVSDKSDANLLDRVRVSFRPEATAGYDARYDGVRMADNMGANPTLFTVNADQQECSRDARPALSGTVTLPLGLRTLVAGHSYTFQADKLTLLKQGQVFLEDRQTGLVQDLATTPAVTFTADGKACAHRFFLRVESAAGTKQPLAPSFETYPNPAEASHKLQFSAHGLRAGTATATLLTTYGTEVLSQPVTVGGNGLLLGELSLAGVKPGIYLLRFTAGNTVVTKRLEVR